MSALDAIWRNSYPTNLTGSPTLCLPNGFTHSGLPTSLQLIGKNFDEMTLLRVGRQLRAGLIGTNGPPRLSRHRCEGCGM